MPRKRLCATFALVAAAVPALCAQDALAGPSPECKVANARTKNTDLELQEAVDAAQPGDRLTVTGTCHGDTTLDFNLTIAGKPAATLDGQNSTSAPGSVLTVGGGSTVALSHLTITGGDASESLHETGGGILLLGGSLTLTSSAVTGNATTNAGGQAGQFGGGGIYNKGGSLTLVKSTVSQNVGLGVGGGIYNSGQLTLTGSTVASNTAVYSGRGIEEVTDGGGIDNTAEGTAVITSSTVSQNVSGAGFGCGYGGGLYSAGSLTLVKSKVLENRAQGFCAGGGILNTGTLLAESTSVTANSALEGLGGGIANYPSESATATVDGASRVSRNVAQTGGGIYSDPGPLVLGGSASVTKNEATGSGGGIVAHTLEFHEWSGTISGNRPNNIETG